MAKQVKSWSKPDNIPNLIGIKKIDYSIYEYGVHIPVAFREDFLDANQGQDIELGKAENIILHIEDKNFEVKLRNIRQASYNKGALQLRYDREMDIKEYLMEAFQFSYNYIKQEQERTGKSAITVPDHLAEYMEFYKTDKPFEYKVKLVKNNSELLPYPLWEIFNGSGDVKWIFSFINKMMTKLEIFDWKDRSFSISYREDKKALHINYYAWRIFGLYRAKDNRVYLELIFPHKDIPFEDAVMKYDFKQKTSETSLGIYLIKYQTVKENEERTWYTLNKVLNILKQRFKSRTSTQFRGSNQTSLAKAIFSQEKLEGILKQGFIIKDYKAWIFQSNAEYYYLQKAAEDLSEFPWRVNQHKELIKPGDRVYLWESGEDAGIVAVGEVSSLPYKPNEIDKNSYYYKKGFDKLGKPLLVVDLINIEKLPYKLLKRDLLNNEIISEISIIKSPQGTNFPVSDEEDEELQRIIDIVIDPSPNPNLVTLPYSPLECSKELNIDIQIIEKWVRSIERKGQAIIYGPPGTGKTYAAKKLAKVFVAEGEGLIDIIQFHPAYAYEDFIQGIRPISKDDTLSYELVKGRFMDFCDKSRERKGKSVLIIDEINRTNLSRVFGELMYLLEYREEAIPLAGGRKFSIPGNIYIIGTMNTADRSIAIVDHALRRRFAFLELQTNYELLKKYHEDTKFPVESLVTLLQQINTTINDKRYEIGVSYFLRENLMEDIQDIWEMEIIPYVEEYFFDQPDHILKYHWDKIEGLLSNEE